jgi:hypothetical protein
MICGMAEVTLQVADRFLAGSPVVAVPAAVVGERGRSIGGRGPMPPLGLTPVAEGVVDAAGVVELDGLEDRTVYALTEGPVVASVDVDGDTGDTILTVVASGGSFVLTVGEGETEEETGPILVGASAVEVEEAIQETAEGGDVVVSGEDGGPYLLALDEGSELEALPAISVDGSGLTVNAGRRTWLRFGVGEFVKAGRPPHPWPHTAPQS